MITAVISVATYIPFTLLDNVGDPVTGKVNADFTKSAYLVSTPATTATATATENASGTYRISFTPTTDGVWHVTWSVSVAGETVRYEETVQVVTAAQADPVTYIATGNIAILSPVDLNADVTLYESDSYDADETRSLDWSTTDAGTWPTLTSATIALKAVHGQSGKTITATGSVVTATGATKEVRVELAPSDTSGKPAGDYDYQVIATLTNAHVVTLASGALTLTARIRA